MWYRVVSLPELCTTLYNNYVGRRAPSSDVTMTSSPSAKPEVEDVSFGDLELFLKGEQLWHLFREHRVEFSDLLNMTDKDLEQVRKEYNCLTVCSW